MEILARETDEKHPLSVPQLVEKLQEHGVVAERKSVYDDLNTLNAMPDAKYEIVQQRGRGGGYYMTDAPFELAELKLLVDAVYASKFITARKSKTLIDKLGQFTSKYRQAELDRKVLVSGRIKSTDEKILYTVDALHSAITAGEQVQFKMCIRDRPYILLFFRIDYSGKLDAHSIPWVVCLILSILTFLGLVIFRGRALKSEIEKRLHL